MGTPNDTDHIIAALAAGQHGVVNRRQLLASGISSKKIAVRVRAKRLLPLYPGVYAAGHAELRREGIAGYTVVRFTYRQVTRQRRIVADRVRCLLG